MEISKNKILAFFLALITTSFVPGAFALGPVSVGQNSQSAPTTTAGNVNTSSMPAMQASGSLASLQQANQPLSPADLNPASPDVFHTDPALIIEDSKRHEVFLVFNDKDDIKRVEKYDYRANGTLKKVKTYFINTATDRVFAVHQERYSQDEQLKKWKIWLGFGPQDNDFRLTGVRKFDADTGVNKRWLSFERDENGNVTRIFEKYPDSTVGTTLVYDSRGNLVSENNYPLNPNNGIPDLGPVTAGQRIRTVYDTDLNQPVPVDTPTRRELRRQTLPAFRRYL